MAVTAQGIEAALLVGLQPLKVEVVDDSAAHAGHAGAGEGSHWTVRVTAAAFAGLGRVARHRLVYHALRDLIPQGIHALVIDARAPDEAR